MFKKFIRYLFPIPMVLALAACSVLKLPGAGSAAAQQSQPNQPQSQPGNPQSSFDPANQPLEYRLALGTLALEGTPNAVTPAEAKNLVVLWKGVKSLSASQTASQDEINALYQQIQDTLTPAQIQAIQSQQVSQAELQTLMQKYKIQLPQGGFERNGTPGAPSNLSQEQIATLRASRSQNGGSGNGGSGFVPGQDFGGNGGFRAQRTPQPGVTRVARSGFRAGGNNIFIDPLITLLEQRAGETPS